MNAPKKYQRILEKSIKESLNRGKSVLLLGPRQTGKTTLVESFQPDLIISFLSQKTRLEFEKNPDLIASYAHGIKKTNKMKTPLIVIDEVQKVPQVMDVIQGLIDKKVAQFIITGSSARKLKMQSDINLLPGRVIYLRMDPITIEENPDSPLTDLLLYGSLPEVSTTVKKEFKEDYLYSYVETYLEEEIRKEALLKKLPDFVKFLEIAALEAGLIINYSSIASEVGISHLTVKSYFGIMKSTLMGDLIQPVTESVSRKKISKSPRFLFFDLGARRVAANEGVKLGRLRLGQIFEQFVGGELLRLIRSHKLRIELNYWRDNHSGEEVDWVLKKAKSYIPIEVKYKSLPTAQDIKHLKTFLSEYHCPYGGFVICETDKRLKLAENIFAISWRDLLTVIEKF